MKQKYLIFLLLVTIMPFSLSAQWLPFDQNNKAAMAPEVTVISDDASGTILKIDIPGLLKKQVQRTDKNYSRADLLTDIFTNKAGFPEVPYIAEILAIPDHAGISTEVIETGETVTIRDIALPPARESWWEGDPEPAYTENSQAYRSDAFYPAETVAVDDPSIMRDFRIARVSVYPARYNPVRKTLEVTTSLTIRVNYGKGEVINPKLSPRRPIAPSYGQIYRSSIANYKQVLDRLYDGREEGNDLMLCIMPDEFVESFQEYALWNRQTGTDIHIAKFSDIGATSNNPTIIHDYIQDVYFNWDTPPTYVLIVGDDGIFPKKIVTYPDYSFPWESYFAAVEGDDYFPEMMVGRFTNQGDYRMQVMINKFTMYERTPLIDGTDWFKKGICCSNNAYESQVETKRFAYGCMTEDGGFTHVDTLMSDGGWSWDCSMDLNDVMGAVNEGRSYLNYRGEGWYYGWYANCYDFSTSDVYDLNNGEKFTFVTSIGCGVAMFDTYGDNNCFGEAWVEMGTLDEPRGGIGFIGPTSNTHTTYNNRIDKGIYVGMFREGMDTPGQALARGKLYMYNVFGNEFWVEYHYKIFCVLGDPSLHIWKDVPKMVEVTHAENIPVGNNNLEVDVTFLGSGLPADSAMVVVTGENVFATAHCDDEGHVVIPVTVPTEETLTVTVRGGNVYPHQSTVEVVQPTELVEPEGEPEMTDINGNNDGLINPNEDCDIAFTLKNWGNFIVNNVQATLASGDPNVSVTTGGPVDYGNMDPGQVVTGDAFEFHVNETCPVAETISLTLEVTTDLSTWDYNFDFEISGCQLAQQNYLVGDDWNPNPNFRMDPGETVRLYFSVLNDGQDIAPEVMGTLSSTDPYITVDDDYADFGTIQMEETGIDTVDYFMVTIDPECPTGYMAQFTLELETQNGYYPYSMTTEIELPVALPVPSDYTGPDDYGYYAFANTDSFFDQTPEYDWVEISGAGEDISMAGETDYTETVDLPFTFKYYGLEYDQLRISTDGWLAMGSGVQTAPVNYALPHNDNVSNMIAVFWDDLYDVQFLDGEILYYHDQANHRFVVEWDSITHNNAGPEPIREEFEAILLNPEFYPTETGDGEIIMQYRKIENPESNTVGIENNSQDIGLQYVFDDDYEATASDIADNVAIKFTTEPPFVSMIVGMDEHPEINADHKISGITGSCPNPFSHQTEINYSLSGENHVSIDIYNINGEIVCKLVDGIQPAGQYSVAWNGRSDDGRSLNTGVYFVKFSAGDVMETVKLLKMDQ